MSHAATEFDPLRMPTPAMRRLARGRWTLRIYVIAVLVISAATVTSLAVAVGPQFLPRGVGRFALTCVLMLCLWRGSQVARWLSVVLLGSAGAVGAMLAVSATAPSAFAWILALMQSTYVPFAVLLALPTPVSDFVRYQGLARRIEGMGRWGGGEVGR